jgi:hypothetical protein
LLSLDEQRDIVQKLYDVSALVDECRREIETTERKTHAMLLNAFKLATDGAPLSSPRKSDTDVRYD